MLEFELCVDLLGISTEKRVSWHNLLLRLIIFLRCSGHLSDCIRISSDILGAMEK